MYLPRELISHLYLHLLRTHHPLSPPVLVLVALEPDALCACRILTTLLKRDYIPHKIQPVSGYGDLAGAGDRMVRPMRTSEGGSGGVVVCLGVGGLVDLGSLLGLDANEDQVSDGMDGVEVWVVDARRPWNLGNVFGGHASRSSAGEAGGARRAGGVENGRIQHSYKPGQGGIIVFDDGDIEDELGDEREAYCALEQMPDVEDDGEDSDASDSDSGGEGPVAGARPGRKRKSWSDREDDEESEEEIGRPTRRRRTGESSSSSSSPVRPSRRRRAVDGQQPSIQASGATSPSGRRSPVASQPSARTLRRRLLRLRRKHEAVLSRYYDLGNSYSEPISSLMYSLASELGRDDNDLLWLAIIGVGSLELYGRSTMGVGISRAAAAAANGMINASSSDAGRVKRIQQILRDEVRRLNPPVLSETGREVNRGDVSDVIPTHARSPTDTSIRLSPEPRFLLIRHWSLYDSMLHSPYLSARLHIWSDAGRKRLHKLLAKMGVSLTQCKQSYTHMDMDLKRGLRARLLKYAPVYGLDDLVPPEASAGRGREGWGFVRNWGFKACLSATDVGVIIGAILEVGPGGAAGRSDRSDRSREDTEPVDVEGHAESEEWVTRFWQAYDALDNVDTLKSALPTAMHLHRAILRTGTALLEKRQIRHLRAFRMAVVKEGPDVQLFTHPAALTKLALWLGEAIAEQEREHKAAFKRGAKGTPLVVAGLNERRGVYVVVGTGRGAPGGDWNSVAAIGPVRHEKKNQQRAERKEQRRKEKHVRRAEKQQQRRAEQGDDSRDDNNDNNNNNDEDDDDESSSSDESSTSSSSSASSHSSSTSTPFPTTNNSKSVTTTTSSNNNSNINNNRRVHQPTGLNRFGNAFQEVVEDTNARVRIDSFEHCVVEVKIDDLAAFLEGLSFKAVVG